MSLTGQTGREIGGTIGWALAGLAGLGLAASVPDWRAAAFAAGFWLLALAIMHRDLTEMLIPDWASGGLAVSGLLRIPVLWPAGTAGDGLLQAAMTGAGAFLALAALRTGYRHWAGREGLGFGDVKLAGAIGLWLDPFGLAVTLQLAALAALGVTLAATRRGGEATRTTAVPFGAFLAPAAFAVHAAGLAWPWLLEAAP